MDDLAYQKKQSAISSQHSAKPGFTAKDAKGAKEKNFFAADFRLWTLIKNHLAANLREKARIGFNRKDRRGRRGNLTTDFHGYGGLSRIRMKRVLPVVESA